jgi:SAM-dependent methyltransferase
MKRDSAEAFRASYENMLQALKSGHELKKDIGNEIDIEILSKFFGSDVSFLMLDGGCGTGRSSLGLGKMGHRIVCFDVIPEAVRLAKKIYHQARTEGDFIIGDILYLPFPDETFNVILSGGVLEHFLHVERPLREYIRVLKKGKGVLAASVPNLFSGFAVFNHILSPKRLSYWLDKSKRLIHHEKLYTFKEAVETVEKNGLQIIEISPFRLDMSLPPLLPAFINQCIWKNQPIQKVFYKLAKIFPHFCFGFSWFFIFAKKPAR